MGKAVAVKSAKAVLGVVREQFAEAVTATKCHGCGCLSGILEAMWKAVATVPDLAPILADARRVLKPKQYD